MKDHSLLVKNKKFLNSILCIFLLILFRIWHLEFIQKEDLEAQAKRPHRKSIIEQAPRGIIVDRFNKPLALNRIRYNATIYYAHLHQIPTIKWVLDENKNRLKTFPRKEYIKNISTLLAKELDMNALDIEDMIHAKASVFPHTPFLIKENISEKQYYRLRLLERKWLGLKSELSSERYYPNNEVACDILGYLGAISQNEYLSIANEIETLETFKRKFESEEYVSLPRGFTSPNQVFLRLEELRKRSYRIHDFIGKCGIEKSFEQSLRGYFGKKIFEIDVNGNFLKELSSSTPPIAGKTLKLSISSELQQFAEKLLIIDEKTRDNKSRIYDTTKKRNIIQKQPWIKGGSIVVMDPNNGDVLALASYPRFNPNDFISSSNPEIFQKKQLNIHKWLETTKHISDIWDGKISFSKEFFNEKEKKIDQQNTSLTWGNFISTILPMDEDFSLAIQKIQHVKNCILIQEAIEELMFLCKEKDAQIVIDLLFPIEESHILSGKMIEEKEKDKIYQCFINHYVDINKIKKKILSFLSPLKNNKDKLFIIDLCRTLVYSPSFSDELIEKIGHLSLEEYWNLSKASLQLEDLLKQKIYFYYKNNDFLSWRELNQKEFLLNKRKEEKQKKISPRPYIDYIKEEEKRSFQTFWNNNRLSLLSEFFDNSPSFNDPSLLKYWEYLTDNNFYQTIQSLSSYQLIKEKLSHLEKDFFSDFFRTIRSFDQLNRPLLGKYSHLRNYQQQQLEKHFAAGFYPINGFGFGRSQAFRQSAPLGSIFKLITAYCALKQNYYDENTLSLNPFSMIDEITFAKKGEMIVGYGLDRKPYFRHYKNGRLPRSSHGDIGLIDLPSAIEQSSNPYFAILAGDFINNPMSLLSSCKEFGFGKKTNINLSGEFPGSLPNDIDSNKTGLYSFAIGQHSLVVTPIQTAVMLCSLANGGYLLRPILCKDEEDMNSAIRSTIFLPLAIKKILFEGMDRVISGKKGNARPSIIKKCRQNKQLYDNYKSLSHQFIGKTSTAEIMYNPNISPSSKAQKYKHLWFGAISFDENDNQSWKKPEIIVVVYLRFGDGGKEAAPLATQIIQKYRELKKKHSSYSNEIPEQL